MEKLLMEMTVREYVRMMIPLLLYGFTVMSATYYTLNVITERIRNKVKASTIHREMNDN